MSFPEWAINPLPKQRRFRGDSPGTIPKPGSEWRLVDHSDSTMWWQQAAASGSLGTSYMRDNVRALHMRDSTYLSSQMFRMGDSRSTATMRNQSLNAPRGSRRMSRAL